MKFYANLKSNHTRNSFCDYANTLNNNSCCKNITVFPPASAFIQNNFNFQIGAQNFYPAKSGSFTGEITKDMLDEFNIKSVIIGHSERRALGESDEFLLQKVKFAMENNWEIVFCIGENLEIKNKNQTKDFIQKQIKILDLNYKKLIIAYEPIWAIGTGISANNETIDEVLEVLFNQTDAPLFYGGSVNIKNIKELEKLKFCSGFLIGSASFEVNNFINLIKESKCC